MQERHRLFLSTKVWLLPALLLLPLAIPVQAQASQEAHFIQVSNYCNPQAGYLQGQIAVFNPSSQTISVEITGNLLYSATSNTTKQDTAPTALTIAPGQTFAYQVTNTQQGYGCHGWVRFFGTVRVTNDTQGLVKISGNLVTPEVTFPNSYVTYANHLFTIPSPVPGT